MKMLAIANLQIGSAAKQKSEERMKGFRSVGETAKKWGISIRWVNQYILEGRVPGCERLGRSWAVPEDAVKPERQKPGVKKREREEKPS